MSSPELLLLVVAYSNREEVRNFCAKIRDAYGGEDVHVAVCDNSPTVVEFNFGATVSVSRPDNPGYWGGALAALNQYVQERHATPNWVGISNTDLEYLSSDIVGVLQAHTSSLPKVVAPRITEDGLEKNPHMISPRPRWRLWANHVVTWSPNAALIYLLASRLRSVLGRSAGRGGEVLASGTRMYSPYGALMFFNSAFLDSQPLWPHVPLLAEEWAVAQMAIQRNASVVFEPRLWVRHEPHQTTGSKVSRGRAKMLSAAFRFIWEAAQ